MLVEHPNHFPFVILGEFVVMPNHVHGIIIIDKFDDRYNDENENSGETQNFAFQPLPPLISKLEPVNSSNIFGPQSQNLGSIIRGFKIGVTKSSRLIQPEFVWQARYHDRIIRDKKSYRNISAYIRNNPVKWSSEKDQFKQVLEI